jgi:hypothetical protein
LNSVNECLNAMRDADEGWYIHAVNHPAVGPAFNRLAALAGERDEVVAAASRWLSLQDHAEKTAEVLRHLLAKYGGN